MGWDQDTSLVVTCVPETHPCLCIGLHVPVAQSMSAVSLVNQAAHTLSNRYLKAHAEAWMCFKYTADHLAGVLVPAQFNHVVWYGSLQEWVEDVLETCRVVGDEDEPEDSQDVSSCSDDLPNY